MQVGYLGQSNEKFVELLDSRVAVVKVLAADGH
jgi:hypothetical protein